MQWLLAFVVVLMSLSLTAASGGAEPLRITKSSSADNALCLDTGPCEKHAIFFVHGLFRSANSWRVDERSPTWQELIARDRDMRAFDTYLVEYDTNFIGQSDRFNEVRRQLTDGMRKYHRSRYKNIILVGHSLGGNLIRDYLMSIKSLYGHPGLARYRIAIFLGTPQLGADLANAASYILPNPQLNTLVEIDKNDFLAALNDHFFEVGQKHEASHCPSFKIFSAYETLPTYGKLIVSRGSATNAADICVKVEGDHVNLAEPRDSSSSQYRFVKKIVLGCARDDPVMCPRPASECVAGQLDYNPRPAETRVRCKKEWTSENLR